MIYAPVPTSNFTLKRRGNAGQPEESNLQCPGISRAIFSTPFSGHLKHMIVRCAYRSCRISLESQTGCPDSLRYGAPGPIRTYTPQSFLSSPELGLETSCCSYQTSCHPLGLMIHGTATFPSIDPGHFERQFLLLSPQSGHCYSTIFIHHISYYSLLNMSPLQARSFFYTIHLTSLVLLACCGSLRIP